MLSNRLFCIVFAIIMVTWASAAKAQIVSFEPLQENDYEIVEQEINLVNALEASGYALGGFWIGRHRGLTKQQEQINYGLFAELRLATATLDPIRFELAIQTASYPYVIGNYRSLSALETYRDQLASRKIGINVDEAFISYSFTPNSTVDLGILQFSIGDDQGKVFTGGGAALRFSCTIGTWCVPFGVVRLGTEELSWTYFVEAYYPFWYNLNQGFNQESLSLGAFLTGYNEVNVPMGKNYGPAFYSTANPDPTNPSADSPLQMLDTAGKTVFYDADNTIYFGTKIQYAQSGFFLHLDYTLAVGHKKVKRFKDSDVVTLGTDTFSERKIRMMGHAVEAQFIYRTPAWYIGLHYMLATGDKNQYKDGFSLPERFTGYNEITPGSYAGTRLYFNGIASAENSGLGLGRSVSNTQMVGTFFFYEEPVKKELAYQVGLYWLNYVEPVYDKFQEEQTGIGIELDNILYYRPYPPLSIELEGNFMYTMPGFATSDFNQPLGKDNSKFLMQGVLRVIYSF